MFRLYDPVSLISGLTFTQAAVAGSTLLAAGTGYAKSQADADTLERKAEMERLQASRDARDAKRNNDIELRRLMAAFAAQGASVGTQSVVASAAGELSRGVTRIQQDSAERQRGLRTAASNTRSAGVFGTINTFADGAATYASLNRRK